MAYSILTVAAAWADTPQYTANGVTEIELINPGDDVVTFITTSSDVKPALPETAASRVGAQDSRALSLADGERLWLACPGLAGGPLSVTLQL